MNNLLVKLLLIIMVADAAMIKIHVMHKEAGKTSNLAGADVQCWDEDFPDGDDVMTGIVKTDANGHASLEYTAKPKSTMFSPTKGWDNFPHNSDPDIFCRVTKDKVIYPVSVARGNGKLMLHVVFGLTCPIQCFL
jgi:Group XII secretory phospholipase A2 precursor (PLA2G12)